jgi:CheY-like chemotaxis protein
VHAGCQTTRRTWQGAAQFGWRIGNEAPHATIVTPVFTHSVFTRSCADAQAAITSPRRRLGETLVTDEIRTQPGRPSGKGRILVVEDDRPFAEALGQVLRRAGFEVAVACDFRAALEILEAELPVDLLLTDIVMPGSVNGIALSRMARLRRRDLKVVYLTGYNVPGVETEASGPILRKPVDDAVLVSEIERALAAP